MLLDTTHSVATPEGVELKLPVAGLAPRVLAWLLDGLIKIAGASIAGMVLAVLGGSGDGLYLIVLFLMLWFYNVLFEVFAHGATPGKKALNLRVMSVNGTPVGWSQSIIRNLIRFVDLLPGCYAFGAVSVLVSDKFQRLGDMAADTVVVHAAKADRPMRLVDVEPEPLTVPLTPEEQQAIVSFGERAIRLNQERADELAAVLEPVIGKVDTIKLCGHAVWLSGRGKRG